MGIVCGVLHHRPVDEEPDYPSLEDIAITSDKYDCGVAMSLWGRITIESHLRSKAYILEMNCLLLPTYVLDSALSFQRLTRILVYRFKGDANPLSGAFTSSVLLEIRDMLPRGIFGKSLLHGYGS